MYFAVSGRAFQEQSSFALLKRALTPAVFDVGGKHTRVIAIPLNGDSLPGIHKRLTFIWHLFDIFDGFWPSSLRME